MAAKKFHLLKVATVRYDTKDAIQIGFRIPKELKNEFSFDPGQYLTIKTAVNDELLRRAYSICSSIHDEVISVLVKRLPGGRVSNFLNDRVKVGDQFEVMPPGGHFKLTLEEKERHCYFFFGAGSGITPLYSMIHSVLEEEPESQCYLLYGNRDEDNMIFKEKLDRLRLVYQGRLEIEYLLSRPKKEKLKGIKKWLGSPKIKWSGKVGRVGAEFIEPFLKRHKEKNIKGYFICGPGQMIEATVEALEELGIDKSIIHREYFNSTDIPSKGEKVRTQIEEGKKRKVKVILDGVAKEMTINDRTDIVSALIANDVEPPYSCLSGTCSTCMAKLTKGEVEMDVSIGLEDDEKAKGFILTCQSHPITDEVELTYDID